MKQYLLVFSECGNLTSVVTYSENEYDALISAYSYVGEDYKLSSNEMRLLFSKSDLKRACEIFQNFAQVDLIFLSEIQNPIINKLDSIIEYPGTNIDCSTCKNNVEYPPPHTCDVCTSLDEEMHCMWNAKLHD